MTEAVTIAEARLRIAQLRHEYLSDLVNREERTPNAFSIVQLEEARMNRDIAEQEVIIAGVELSLKKKES